MLATVLAFALLGAGCSPDEAASAPPLQPLIYTEFPNLTAEAAAVRERRLMRQLSEGALAGGQWGDLETSAPEDLPATPDAEALGRVIYEALIERRDELWEHAFISPADYAKLVFVSLEAAGEFVDNLQGKSYPTWTMFDVEQSSEAPEGGLAPVLAYEELRLGQGRTVDGPVAKTPEDEVQYWGNALVLRLRDTNVTLELTIPKIVRLRRDDGPDRLVAASEIVADRRLEVFINMGLHLKPELLRSREYPFPLKVGNFWRYRRTNVAQATGAAAEQAQEPELDGAPAGFGDLNQGVLDASEVLLEVEAVERYETLRLVRLARTYNDQDQSRYIEHWLLTPRQIYLCHRQCQNNIGNLQWLLEFFENQVPIYRFPALPGLAWRRGGHDARKAGDAVFRADAEWHALETAAGTFTATVAIDGTGPLGQIDHHLASPDQRRYFAAGRGDVRRHLKGRDLTGQPADIVEELVEYRIMP